MKKKVFFFGVLILVLYNIIGCNKNEPAPMVIDPESSVFKFTGNVIDSTVCPDTSKGPWLAPNTATFLVITNRDVSGTIRFNKNSDSIILLSRPKRDSLAYYSGALFRANDSSYLSAGYYGDTVITSKYINNAIIIPSQITGFTSVGGNVQINEGVGKFTIGQWELTYRTRGRIGSYLFANHAYHLICTK